MSNWSRKTALAAVALGLIWGGGCNRNEQDGRATGIGGTGADVTGDAHLSSGSGGQGAGPTGTQGDESADNPAADGTQR